MPDVEKVIKGLEWILNDIEENGHYQVSYYADEIRKAIALLREQETTFVLEHDRTNHYHCTACGYVTGIIARMHKFCPECGRKVKWE